MNPVLPLHHRVPDVEARVFDGRLYLYGSYDKDFDTYYCSQEYHVFSTADLQEFTDHGICMKAEWTPSPNTLLYAPDCVKIGNTYYLFWASSCGREWVAQCATPTGPFSNVREVHLPVRQIDPAVLVDDDGAVYYYWGQFQCHAARLLPGLDAIDPATYQASLLDEMAHGFHEGASIRKIGGLYYLVYSDVSGGRATRLSYATAESPLGPFTKQGAIIDCVDCDPESWNNHGSIVEFNGQWYICYHRSSMCREGMRRLCMERISLQPDGSIAQVEMTTQGPGTLLQPRTPLPAVYACLLRGKVRMDRSERYLTRLEDGSGAAYKYFDFAGEDRFGAACASLFAGCRLRVRLDAWDGEVLGEMMLPCTGGWVTGGIDGFANATLEHRPVYGRHAVFLEAVCSENRFFNLQEFVFWKHNAPGAETGRQKLQ